MLSLLVEVTRSIEKSNCWKSKGEMVVKYGEYKDKYEVYLWHHQKEVLVVGESNINSFA